MLKKVQCLNEAQCRKGYNLPWASGHLGSLIKVEFKNVYMGTVRGEPALCIKLCTFQPDIPGLECQNFPGGRFTETPAGVMSA